MTRNEMLDALCAASPGEFDIVLAKLAVPLAYLSSSHAAQATRAAELLRYVEQQGRLAELERALQAPPAPKPSGKPWVRRAAIAASVVMLLSGTAVVRWR